jgi:hypothetical protein
LPASLPESFTHILPTSNPVMSAPPDWRVCLDHSMY